MNSPESEERSRLPQRIDKFLVYARFVKHRARAAELVEQGAVRINRVKCTKASDTVKPGDILTLNVGRNIEVVKILSEPERRGPASTTSQIYELIGEQNAGSSD
jgi:ribosome-associated heat shock protein Hsp15